MSTSVTRNMGRYVSCYEPEEERFGDQHAKEISTVGQAWIAEFSHNPSRPDYATLKGILEKRVDAAFPEIPLRGFEDLKNNMVLSVLGSMRWQQ